MMVKSMMNVNEVGVISFLNCQCVPNAPFSTGIFSDDVMGDLELDEQKQKNIKN